MKTLILILFAALPALAQSVNTKNPNGTITMRPARLAYEVKCETATSLAGPWFTVVYVSGSEPCYGMSFTTPPIRSSEPQRFWRLVIVR